MLIRIRLRGSQRLTHRFNCSNHDNLHIQALRRRISRASDWMNKEPLKSNLADDPNAQTIRIRYFGKLA